MFKRKIALLQGDHKVEDFDIERACYLCGKKLKSLLQKI
jgi:hypothetical protein